MILVLFEQGLAAATATQLTVDEEARLNDKIKEMSVSSSGGAGTAEQEKKQQEEVTRRRETVLRWILTSVQVHSASEGNSGNGRLMFLTFCVSLARVQSGDRTGYGGYVLPLLDVVYECARDREEDVAMLGKHAARFLARGLWFKTRDIKLLTPSLGTEGTGL